jgi:NAD(P)-dependent dehydrogenase (short-subunit alcohol dehydrogenase family)
MALTKVAARELARQKVTVNAVAPGFIDTEMTRGLPAAVHAERVAAIGMGRIGTAQDVARTIAFLCSDDAAYVTGQVIGVDGGMLI